MRDWSQVKERLESERERLRQQLIWIDTELTTQPHSLQDAMPETGDDELADDATQTYTQELDAALSRRTSDRLNAVEATLERITVGQFGVCVHCGKAIAQGRLDALPWVPYCLTCAQELEVLD